MRAASDLLVGTATALFTIGLAAHASAAQAPGTSASRVALGVSAIGCVAQAPDTAAAPPTGHEQGAAKGLTLARATVKSPDGRAIGDPPRSAVPGSAPEGVDTTNGASRRSPLPVEQSFWLVGAKSSELTRFVGKRVEVSGSMDDRLTANPGMPAGVTDAGAAAGRRATTAPPDTPAPAHPSAPSRSISVLSFRLLGDGC